MAWKTKQEAREYYAKTKEARNLDSKKSHLKYRDQRLEKLKEYYQKTKETKAEYNKTYWNANKLHLNKKSNDYYYKNRKTLLPKMRIIASNWEKRHRQKRNKDQLRNYLKFARLFNLKSWEYKDTLRAWSQLVRNRDHNSCLQCGKPSRVSHHIIYKKTMPELSLNLSNGIALCSPCHKEIHKLNR